MQILNSPAVIAIRIASRIQTARSTPVFVIWGIGGGQFEASWRVVSRYTYDQMTYMRDEKKNGWRLLGAYNRDIGLPELTEDVEAWFEEHTARLS